MSKQRHFRRGQSTYICGSCGKRTRDTTGEGNTELCLKCYDLAGIENSHMDGCCDLLGEPCPFCAQEAGGPDPWAFIQPVERNL